MKTLEEIIYDWLLDYMTPENAKQLAALLAYEARQYRRYQFLAGVLTGSLIAVIFIIIFL